MSNAQSFNERMSGPSLSKNRSLKRGKRLQTIVETAEAPFLRRGIPREHEDTSISPLLASFISHDLRHHLSSIYCNVESMGESGASPVAREQLLEEVRSTIHDMTDLLDALILHARSGSSLYTTPESLNVLIEHAVGMLRSHPDAKGVEIRIAEAPYVHAWIDRKLLSSAVYNLVLNACQAAKRGSGRARVEVALYENDGSIYIRVEDSGPGISQNVRKDLFEPFMHAGKTNGAGLGLMIVESTAKRHGGVIYTDESSSGNTVFVMRLSKFALQAFSKMAPDTASRLPEIC